MELVLVERLVDDLLKDMAEGRLEEEVVAEALDGTEVAEAEVVVGLELLQGVELLSNLLSDPMAGSLSRRLRSSPKAARICDMFGLSDIFTSELGG